MAKYMLKICKVYFARQWVIMDNCYNLYAYIISPNNIFRQLDAWSCLDNCSFRNSCMHDDWHIRTK